MSVAGDYRFLSWGCTLQPCESQDQLRYLLFFNISNRKLLLINSNTQEIMSYAFSCVSECAISSTDDKLLTLDLDNSAQQTCTIKLYFDSEYDRHCCNELLSSILSKSIDQSIKKYGVAADIEIGCQIQQISSKQMHQNENEWKPRVLSLVQNRILFFCDKSTDYHPLSMISLNDEHIQIYKTQYYDHTIQLHLSNGIMHLIHLGDESSFNTFISKLKSAIGKYNKLAIVELLLIFLLLVRQNRLHHFLSIAISQKRKICKLQMLIQVTLYFL